MIMPIMIPLLEWANSLLIDFPDDNLPILEKEEDWKEWGENLKLSDNFSNIPTTYGYDNFNDWAYEVYYIMEN